MTEIALLQLLSPLFTEKLAGLSEKFDDKIVVSG